MPRGLPSKLHVSTAPDQNDYSLTSHLLLSSSPEPENSNANANSAVHAFLQVILHLFSQDFVRNFMNASIIGQDALRLASLPGDEQMGMLSVDMELTIRLQRRGRSKLWLSALTSIEKCYYWLLKLLTKAT